MECKEQEGNARTVISLPAEPNEVRESHHKVLWSVKRDIGLCLAYQSFYILKNSVALE